MSFAPREPMPVPPPNSDDKPLTLGQEAIPDLLRIGQIPSNQNANIDTDILEPINFSETHIRYQLVNKGFLNPYSRLTFGLENISASSASNERSFLPLQVGVGSVIKSVTLKIGSQTIQSVQDFSSYFAYKSMFINNEINKEREAYFSGRQIAHQQFYEETQGGTNDKDVCTTLALDNGKDFFVRTPSLDSDLVAHPFQIINNKPVFSITLEELIPMFKNTAFPLYLLNSDMPVQIELELQSSTDGSRVSMNGCGTSNHLVDFTLNRNECRMIADYTTYDSELMNSYREANKTLNWTYMDYQLTKLTINNASDIVQDIIRNVGGAGRMIPRMFVAVEKDDGTPYRNLLNKYSSTANANSGASYGVLTTNIKKNDRFLFPIDRTNDALHYHSVTDTEGMTPFILRDEYAGQGQRLATANYEENEMKSNLQGKFFYQAYKMPDNNRVNSRGLELHNNFNKLPVGTYTLRCYIEAIKVATLKDGNFDVTYA